MGPRLPLLLVLGLSACAGPLETRVVSSGQGIDRPDYILQEEAPQSEPLLRAHIEAMHQLADRGFMVSDKGTLKFDIAFAERDASIAVLSKSGDKVQVIAPAKQKKPLQNCADREMRLTLTLTRIADGAEVYRGSASEYHCKAQAVDVVPEMVKAAMADLAKPKGAYSIKRQGLE
jgi:hypothetical protein